MRGDVYPSHFQRERNIVFLLIFFKFGLDLKEFMSFSVFFGANLMLARRSIAVN